MFSKIQGEEGKGEKCFYHWVGEELNEDPQLCSPAEDDTRHQSPPGPDRYRDTEAQTHTFSTSQQLRRSGRAKESVDGALEVNPVTWTPVTDRIEQEICRRSGSGKGRGRTGVKTRSERNKHPSLRLWVRRLNTFQHLQVKSLNYVVS